MNELYLRIMNLETRIEQNRNYIKTIKALAGVCVFFCLCYVLGAKSLWEEHKIAALIVCILSMIVTIVLFFVDVRLCKGNKELEFEIYRLEVEDLENKKIIAEVRREGLSDIVLDKKIDRPSEDVPFPIAFYSVMLALDILIGILLWL